MRIIVLLTAGLLTTSALAKDSESPTTPPAPATAPDGGKEKAKGPEQPSPPSTPAATSEETRVKAKTTEKTDESTRVTPLKSSEPAQDHGRRDKNKQPPAKADAHLDAAYGRLVAAEIRRHIPNSSRAPGSVDVTFTVGASGHVTSHDVRRSSNPELTARVGKILASVKAPPPPGGSYFAHQVFIFH
jgi:outer membrane biosynthesis protein TonB